MQAETKKETPSHAAKQMDEVIGEDRSSPTLYIENSGKSISNLNFPFFSEKKCKRCGKLFIPTKPVYAWKDCCSYTCWLHQDERKPYPTKPVEQYSKSGVLMATFESANDAALFVGLKKPQSVRNCCTGKSKYAAGFIWKYKEVKKHD